MGYWSGEENHPRARRDLASWGCPECGGFAVVSPNASGRRVTDSMSPWSPCPSCPVWLETKLPCARPIYRWLGRYINPIRIQRTHG
jgi:hypothetical protein